MGNCTHSVIITIIKYQWHKINTRKGKKLFLDQDVVLNIVTCLSQFNTMKHVYIGFIKEKICNKTCISDNVVYESALF